MIIVREEHVTETPLIEALIESAFGRRDEARLVNALRSHTSEFVSLVVLDAGELIANAVLTAVTIEGALGVRGLGLAPVCVSPQHRGRGIGTALVRHALQRSMHGEVGFAVVWDDTEYYARFGFKPASAFGLRDESAASAATMQAVEFWPGALRHCTGTVRYAPEFSLVAG
jgi:putative acetyltransferase